MPLFTRKPDLPAERADAWQVFQDCALAIEGARRVLLGTLPTGRVEPAPVAVGVEALSRAIADVRGWMPGWRIPELTEDWDDCVAALDEAAEGLVEVESVAATTFELEELLGAVTEVIAPLDAFADAERAWLRLWRIRR